MHGRPVMPVLQATHEPESELLWLFKPDFDTVGYADIHRPGLRSLNEGRLLFSIGSVGNNLGGLPMVSYALMQCSSGAAPAPFASLLRPGVARPVTLQPPSLCRT